MRGILLYIREPGKPAIAEKYPSHDAAREALLAYVKAHWRFDDAQCPTDVDRAIRVFFARTGGKYVIAEVDGGALDALGFPGEA